MKFTIDSIHSASAARRRDALLAFRVEVALIFLEMLGKEDAREYLERYNVPEHVVEKVLSGHAVQRDQSV
jgi:hypothetical protein